MATTFLDAKRYRPILPSGEPSQPSDLDVAVAAAIAAARAAQEARGAPLKPRTKGVAADVVTEADHAAEAAAVAILRRHRPRDGVLGEEGTQTGGRARRWVVDGVDGTVAFANRLPGGWCSAVALEDPRGPRAAAVYDPQTRELHSAQRGAGGTVATVGDARPQTIEEAMHQATSPAIGGAQRTRVRGPRRLDAAHVAVFLRQDRLVLPGVRDAAHALLDAAGLLRHAGPGSLELAWVAAGRLDAWVQPQAEPWDWLPGALLVTEAGGAARTHEREGTLWQLAGHPDLVDELQQRLALR
jgi:myo-inositol-1(or 4)-monophosphatase